MRTLRFYIPLLLLSVSITSLPQTQDEGIDRLVSRFAYNSRNPLDFRESGVEERGHTLIIDFDYAGMGDARVPAYLVVPEGGGPYAGILWGHWMMAGSPLRNRDEFLEEAVALSRAGVVSLLIDAPMVRPGYSPKSVKEDPLGWAIQSSLDDQQMIVDLRRGMDVLLSHYHVDPHRVAYVGHSFSAHLGPMLAASEKRIGSFVLMAGNYSDEEIARSSPDKDVVRWRQDLGEQKMNQYFADYAWDDPIHFLGHTDGDHVLLQFASRDPVSPAMAERYLGLMSATDKKLQFYECGHALNAAARQDRVRWLQQHLKFGQVKPGDLEKIPQLK
jgi:cephalosporin-C deacetylase-like acetyl esterase